MLLDEVKNGYFYLCIAKKFPISEYHELEYFTSEESLCKYLDRNYRGTDGEEILGLSIDELKKGITYMQTSRMGGGVTPTYVRVFHNDNIWDLFSIIDKTIQTDCYYDCDDEEFYFSNYLKNATEERDIIKAVARYNNCFENYY